MNLNPSGKLFCASGFVALLACAFYFNSNIIASNPSLASDSKENVTIRERIPELGKIEKVKSEVKLESQVIFNDPAMSEKWDLQQAGAKQAWDLSTGNRDIIVAVIDTGIQEDHEDLKRNLWVNTGETGKDSKGRNKATNKIDDDGNGFVDDVHGWNFVENNNKLTDNHGHGSHISGIIGAEGGNGKGISGIAPKVSMMTLKYYDPKHSGADNLKNTIKAIRYAIKMGAHIINYSGGGTDFSQEEFLAVKEARDAGILFVAAAGNERSNSDIHKYYPADYELDNIISVTATDVEINVLPSSNWGIETVHIAAPGHNILSTLPGNNYGYMTGTSQATAFVSGAAAVILSHKVGFTYKDVRKYILSTGDKHTSLAGKTANSRKLNLYRSLAMLDNNVNLTGAREVEHTRNWHRYLAEAETQNPSNQIISQFSRSLLNHIQKASELDPSSQLP